MYYQNYFVDSLLTRTQFIWEDILIGRRSNMSSASKIRLEYPMLVTHTHLIYQHRWITKQPHWGG